MRKLILISLILISLSSCSSPESDGKRAGELACKIQKLLQENMQLALDGKKDQIDQSKMEDLKQELEDFKAEIKDKYKDSEDRQRALEAMQEEMKNCN